MNSNRSSNQGQAKAKGKNSAQKRKRNDPAPQEGPKQKKRRLQQAPTAMSRQELIGAPSLSRSGKGGSIRIKHREYIQDVNGSILFANQQFPINPGMAATFPWLSTIAQLFESYRIHKLRFEFETQRTVTDGSVMLAVDFDAADAAPANKQQLMSFSGAVRSAVWQECEYDATARNLHKFGPQRYNRTGPLAANLDIKTYDVGVLNVATQGCVSAVAVGELYVSYDIEFETPQVNASGVIGGTFATTTGVATATPFGTLNAGSALGNLISSVSATVATLQGLVVGQEYLICAEYIATTITPGATLFTVTGLTLKTEMDSASAVSIEGSLAATFTATASTATVAPNVTLSAATALNFVVAPIVVSSF